MNPALLMNPTWLAEQGNSPMFIGPNQIDPRLSVVELSSRPLSNES